MIRLKTGLLATFMVGVAAVQGTSFLSKVYLGTGACLLQTGSGTPESAVSGTTCDFYLRTNGAAGTILYIKESGSGTTTGWVAYSGAGATAPLGATYITQTADATLSAEQALGLLATGYMKNTTTTGVVSVQAVPIPGTDGGTNNVFFQVSGPASSLKTFTFPNANSTMVALDSADMLTNKTLDAEGTGNVISATFKHWLKAGWCQGADPLSAWSVPLVHPAVMSCDTGTNTQKATWDFADGVNALSIQDNVALPSDFTSTIDVRVKWFTAAIVGDVVWQVATICVADAETADPAFNTASTVTDTAKGTTLQLNDASATSITVTGCAAGETLRLRIFRDADNAGDTMTGDAELLNAQITVRRSL